MQHPELAEHPDVDYQRSTISVRAVAWFVVIFILFGIASQVLLWTVYAALHRSVGETNVSASALMQKTVEPPEPRLQPSPGHEAMPWQDLQDLQIRDREEFKRRGWLNETTGNVVIPDSVVQQVTAISAHGAATRGAI